MKEKIVALVIMVLVLSFSIVGYGDKTVEQIQAYLDSDMKFRVDGEAFQPKDLDGTPLYPIIFNGRSYVPVRALLESKGVKVDYDNEERTIILDYSDSTGIGGWDVSKVKQADTDGIGGWDVSKVKQADTDGIGGWDVSKVKQADTDGIGGWDVSKVKQADTDGIGGWDVSKVKQADTDGIGGWDVSKLKREDLNSHLLMDIWEVKDNSELKLIDFNSEKLTNMQKMSFVNESTFVLSDDAEISLNGKRFSINDTAKEIEVLEYRNADSGNTILNSNKLAVSAINGNIVGISLTSISRITLEYNNKLNQVTVLHINSMDQDEDGKFNLLALSIEFEKGKPKKTSIIQKSR